MVPVGRKQERAMFVHDATKNDVTKELLMVPTALYLPVPGRPTRYCGLRYVPVSSPVGGWQCRRDGARLKDGRARG